MLPQTGTTIRVDPALGFQSLLNEDKLGKSNLLKQFNITLDIGRVKNVNHNPVAECAIKEFKKEEMNQPVKSSERNNK